MSAFSPIPNALFAGSYNGSFHPHGAVTFSGRAMMVVLVYQEICVDANVVTAADLSGEAVTEKTLTGLIEEC